jgi:hypothetical protein
VAGFYFRQELGFFLRHHDLTGSAANPASYHLSTGLKRVEHEVTHTPPAIDKFEDANCI